jgi:hypothetical protein
MSDNKCCDGCKRPWRGKNAAGRVSRRLTLPLGPMLHDATWAKLADEDEKVLCAECTSQRAKERGVRLSLADLRPCQYNLFYWPNSWFNLFLGREPSPTIVDDEWMLTWLDSRGPWG